MTKKVVSKEQVRASPSFLKLCLIFLPKYFWANNLYLAAFTNYTFLQQKCGDCRGLRALGVPLLQKPCCQLPERTIGTTWIWVIFECSNDRDKTEQMAATSENPWLQGKFFYSKIKKYNAYCNPCKQSRPLLLKIPLLTSAHKHSRVNCTQSKWKYSYIQQYSYLT